MSWQASKIVWEKSKQTGGLKLTLLAIADFARPENGWTCEASIETLAKMVGVSDRQIKKNLKALEDCGELVVERQIGRGNTNQYSLKPLIKGEPDDTFYEQEKVNSSAEKVNSGAVKGEPDDTQTNITKLTNENKIRGDVQLVSYFEGMTGFTPPHNTTDNYAEDWLVPIHAILGQSQSVDEAMERLDFAIQEMRRKRYTIKSPRSCLTMALNWQPGDKPRSSGHSNANGRSPSPSNGTADDGNVWDLVLAHARRGDSKFDDPAIRAAVVAYGWPKLQGIPTGKENFYKPDFMRIYHEQSTVTTA